MDDIDTTCDGMFLIVDTARHNGWDVDPDEVQAHLAECGTCHALGLG